MIIAKLLAGTTQRPMFRAILNALVDIANLVRPVYAPGIWYDAPLIGTTTTGTAVTANKIRMLPFLLPREITITDLSIRVATLAAGGNAQIAIYGAGANGFPTGPAVVSTGNLSTAVASVDVSATLASPVTLPAGLYYGGVNADNSTAAFKTVGQSNNMMAVMVGAANLADLSPGGNNNSEAPFSVDQAFGTWPDLTNASFTRLPTNNTAQIRFKIASN